MRYLIGIFLSNRISRLILLVYLFLVSSFVFAQPGRIWYFGNGAGLVFLSNKPDAVDNGSLFTEEGTAVAADAKGNLLFYTNGVTVWNNYHEVINGGHGLNGNISSTQSAIILPLTGKDKQYYIFTVAQLGEISGLSYSIVDMNKNAGKGEVVLKNRHLLSEVTEKVTAIISDKQSWVIAHKWNSESYYAFPVTITGIGTPVVSKIGMWHGDMNNDGINREAMGSMKVSHDGKKLAIVLGSEMNDQAKGDIEILDFDVKTGKLSSPVHINTTGLPYGLEFSPDNNKLYVSYLAGHSGVEQYDLQSKKIIDSRLTITPRNNALYGAMQLGPNNKIYIAKPGAYLDVIQSPNALGKHCNYLSNAVSLRNSYSTYGLPNFPVLSTLVHEQNTKSIKLDGKKVEEIITNRLDIDLGKDVSLFCENSTTLDAGIEGAEYMWSNGETSSTIEVAKSGMYWVRVKKNGYNGGDTVYVKFEAKPTAFRALEEFNPNNAMVNNAFNFSVNDVEDFVLTVYKGKKVIYRTTDTMDYWKGKLKNGKNASPGKYKWTAEYKEVCSGKRVKKEGIVRLER